mgnify:CR=1 FL=1
MSGTRLYLLAYDIADPRRLARVARIVSREALRIQYSVYVAELSHRQLRDLVATLRQAVDPRADDLRIYPLPARLDAVWYGRATWPDGIQFEDPLWTGLTAGRPSGYRRDASHANGAPGMINSPGTENFSDRTASSLKTGGKLTKAVQKQT